MAVTGGVGHGSGTCYRGTAESGIGQTCREVSETGSPFFFSVIHFLERSTDVFLVENRERHVTIMEIRALSMESLSDQRENIGRLALSVCVRERFWFEALGEVKSSWISWCAMVLSKGDDDDDDDGHDGDGSISMMFNLRIVSRSGQSVGLQGDFAVRTSGSLAI